MKGMTTFAEVTNKVEELSPELFRPARWFPRYRI